LDLGTEMNKVQKLLSSLGKTPDQVAASLHAIWIHGNPQETSNCPISAYLMQKAHVQRCWVGNSSIIFISRWTGSHLQVEMSDTIKEFVERFDRGEYPALQIFAHYPELEKEFEWLQ
jgi:hypothetical protein